MGLFITFEGVDGCGKSTQMRFLAETLTEKGYSVVTTREPGGCGISEQIRDMLLSLDNEKITDKTEAYLYAASRCQHVEEVIKPAYDAGNIVLCDRFLDSSLAYQGMGRNLGIDTVFELNRYAVDGCMPEKTFFIDYPPELAFERMSKKRVHDRLETQSLEFYNQLYDGFKKLYELYPERIVRIDASGDKFQTRAIIEKEMFKIIAEYKYE